MSRVGLASAPSSVEELSQGYSDDFLGSESEKDKENEAKEALSASYSEDFDATSVSASLQEDLSLSEEKNEQKNESLLERRKEIARRQAEAPKTVLPKSSTLTVQVEETSDIEEEDIPSGSEASVYDPEAKRREEEAEERRKEEEELRKKELEKEEALKRQQEIEEANRRVARKRQEEEARRREDERKREAQQEQKRREAAQEEQRRMEAQKREEEKRREVVQRAESEALGAKLVDVTLGTSSKFEVTPRLQEIQWRWETEAVPRPTEAQPQQLLRVGDEHAESPSAAPVAAMQPLHWKTEETLMPAKDEQLERSDAETGESERGWTAQAWRSWSWRDWWGDAWDRTWDRPTLWSNFDEGPYVRRGRATTSEPQPQPPAPAPARRPSAAGPLPGRKAQVPLEPQRKAVAVDFDEELRWAVLLVLEDMMQLKYGVSIDQVEMRQQLSVTALLSLQEGHDVELNDLRIVVQPMSFQELRGCVRLCAGSCCAVLLPPKAALRLSGEAVLCRTRHGLSTVRAEDFVSCVALEPRCDLKTTAEFAELCASVAVEKPSAELLTALHGPLSARSLKACAVVLGSEKHRPQVVKRLSAWMETQSAAFHQALQQAPELRTALVRALAGCVELLHIVSSARGHVATLCGFVEAGAVEAVCRLLQRHKSNKEVQRRGLFCVSCLVHHGGAAARAVTAEAVPLALRAMATHKSVSVQIKGCELLRLLAEQSEVPLDQLADAAVHAKRLFPMEATLHRAANLLLTFVVPRSAACIGALLDAAAHDEMVQRSGIASLGRLAQHGGVAWGAASLGAVNRIQRALELHRGAELQAVGLWALGRLAERLEPAVGGLQDAALRAQRLHPQSALVQRHAEDLINFLLRP